MRKPPLPPRDGLVDIHAHLLPGIDDGPEDLAGALDMARTATMAGIETIAATPHLRSDYPRVHVEELAERCQALQTAADREGIAIRIVTGAEVSLLWALEAGDDELRLATYGQRGHDLLIETPDDITSIAAFLFHLRSRGVRVTLAHPERSGAFQRDPRLLESLVEQGVLLQVNAGPLMSGGRGPVRSLAEHLCRHGLTHVIASDSHRASSWRPVSLLPAGVEAAAALVGRARASWMTSAAPAAILAGAELPAPPPLERRGRRRWGRRH
jgi:protein-tyrosine phosphatase